MTKITLIFKDYIFPFITCLFYFSLLSAQNHKIDSLRKVLITQKDDTNKVKTLNDLANTLNSIIPDSAISIAQQAGKIAAKLSWREGEADASSNIGKGYWVKGDYQNALNYYQNALKIAELIEDKSLLASTLSGIGTVLQEQGHYTESLEYYLRASNMDEESGNKKMLASVLCNIGNVYRSQADYPKAMDYELKALKMAEDNGYKQLQASVLGNIGIINKIQGNYSSALDYYQKSLKLVEELKNKKAQASILNNIGNVNAELGDMSNALKNYVDALKIEEEMGNEKGKEFTLGNIGIIYEKQGNYTQALENLHEALRMAQEIGENSGIARNLSSIGALFTKTGKFKEAEEYLKKAIALDSTIGEQNDLWEVEKGISKLYDTTGRYELALLWYKKAMVLKDTLFNIDKNKALTRKELTYQFEKKEATEKAEQEKKDVLAEADKKKQRIIIYSVIGGLALALIFAAFILRSLSITQKQKQIIERKSEETEKQKILIEHQKQIVEEKNKDILDSITYAKRLQDAILPPTSLLQKYFSEFLVLYKPKDIVAGDFYWMERAGGNILIAAADCTGHGVPGAMVSVVCSNALNRAVKEFNITEPGKILDKVRELVVETFSHNHASAEKNYGNVQDGMDISLCCINTDTKELQWSGANNSLYIIPPPLWGAKAELNEILPDKQPIGYYPVMKPFTNHTITFSPLRGDKGGCLYLLTDGFADQFGGNKGKKFKSANLKEKLVAICHLPLAEQKEILNDDFEKWKGDLEQTDDVCIIGIRI